MNTKNQEVIIYHAQYIKAIDNLSNLNPSSCILANARKLTNVEIHSTELYNINVTNNTFLRTINLEGCSTLGTVTATGSSLDLSNCKYLKYCNVYNTALTEVQLNTSGGSLIEILYPKTIQSINLIKQRLLEKIGLPYGSGGEEIPTSLYTISIQECPNIKYLNTSDNSAINTTFASMVYCNNLTLRNSLDLKRLTFDGFYRLKNVVIENMYNLEEIGFNDLLPKGDVSTLQYIGLSNCPLLEVLELNCSSDAYEITFANKAILNLGGLFGLKSIQSNCVLKGIETIVVPLNLESMFFTNEYGEGYSTIKNIWSSSVCTVNTAGSTAKAQHLDPTYEGIDFAGMNLRNIDLGALVNIPKAINFTLYPTSVNPNFNLNRDGETYPYLQPEGTLDLSNYTESLAKFFDGVDLDKLKIVCTKKLPQTDLSYCFYNSIFSNDTAINTLLSNVSSITNLDYCFYRTTVTDTSILSKISMGESSTMNYTFAECPNITILENVTIPSSVIEVEGMFYKCPLTSITNMTVNVQGSISGLFKGCTELTTITTLRIPNITDVSSTFEGCTSLTTLTGFELPSSCTNVSNLFNGCYMLTELAMNFGQHITAGDNWFPPNLETLNNTTISNNYVKLTNCGTLKNINNLTLIVSDIANFFTGTTALKNINNLNIGGTLTSVEGLLKDKALETLHNITFGDSITNFTSCFENVPCITNDTIINMPNHENKTLDYSRMFAACVGITQVVDTVYVGNGSNYSYMYAGCTNITKLSNLTINGNILSGMFSGCTGITSVSNISTPNATSMSDMFNGCTKIPSIILNIPNTCKNIDNLFQGCSLLTDISGMTFGSGITSATDWIKDCPITTANNITIKNDIVKFDGCNTLKEVQNLTITNTVTNLEAFLENCTSLTKFSFNKDSDLSKVTTIKRFLVGNKIISTLDFSGFNLTSLDIMCTERWGGENLGFIANTNVSYVDFSNCEFGNKRIVWEWITNNCNTQESITFDFTNAIMPVINFNRFGWGSSAKTYFKFNGADFKYWTTFARMFATDATYVNGVDFTDAKFSHITDFSDMFNGTELPQENLIQITEDIVFPSTATNVERAFKGCTKLTHIHSNWNNTYTNGITSTDCYAGCTGITHCDNVELGVSENHSGLEEVPIDWGGYGFTKATTGIYEVVIPSDNYTVSFGYKGGGYSVPVFINEGTIDWGDGTVTTKENFTTEGYYAPHTYSKAGTYIIKGKVILGNSLGETSEGMKNTLTRILQYPNNYPCFSMCKNCTQLIYVNATGWKLYNSISNGNLESMFRGCSKLTVIEGINTWDTSGVKNINELFQNCTNLREIKGINNLDVSKVTSMVDVFGGCQSLETLDLSNWNVGNVQNFRNMFYNCKSITNLDLSNWDISKAQRMDSMFCGTSKLNSLALNWDLSHVFILSKMFQGTGLSTIEGITFSEEPPSNTDANARRTIDNFVRECPNLTSINVDLRGFCRHDEMFRDSPNISYIKSIDFTYDVITANTNLGWNTKFNNLTDLNITGTIPNSISHGFNNMPNLTVKCLTDIINALVDLSGSNSKTCYLGATNIAKLSSDVIAIATNKNWTVV